MVLHTFFRQLLKPNVHNGFYCLGEPNITCACTLNQCGCLWWLVNYSYAYRGQRLRFSTPLISVANSENNPVGNLVKVLYRLELCNMCAWWIAALITVASTCMALLYLKGYDSNFEVKLTFEFLMVIVICFQAQS